MGVLLRIAYRNLREHKVKTLIIGSIIAFGMMILVIGNSVLDTATAGIKANYTENYTGHVIIAAGGTESPMLTPDGAAGPGGPGSLGIMPTIPEYPQTLAFLESYPGVVDVNPMITGMATLEVGGEGFGFMQYYGVDPDEYLSFFRDNIVVTEGRFLISGQEGVVLSQADREILEDSASRDLEVGDHLLLTAQNERTGTKIRETEIVGFFEFASASFVLDFISFVDLETARVLSGMTVITDLDADLTPSERLLLGTIDEDDLFSGELFSAVVSPDPAGEPAFELIIGDVALRDQMSAVDPNAWQYILVRLADEGRARNVARDLNREFEASGSDLVAFEWLDGAGTTAEFTYALKTVFNFLVVLIAFVSVIIIMNTLVISVTERFAEIGTMRAIGAQKRFVRGMIVYETLMISVVSGVVGIALGSAITGVLGAVGITTENAFLQVFMGGPVLSPVVSVSSVIVSALAVLAAGLLASLYPASIALRIQPVVAMSEK